MKKLLLNITNGGINEKTDFHLSNKIRVFNNATVIIFFVSLFYSIIGLINGYYVAELSTAFSCISNVVCLILVRKGKYKLAFHYTMWYSYAFLSAFTLLFGGINNSYYYFLFVPVACNILFDSIKTTIIYASLCAVFMILNVYYINTYQPYYHLEAWMLNFSYPNIVFVIILIFLGVRLFKQNNLKYIETINEQKQLVEEKNLEITQSIQYAEKIQRALIPSEPQFRSVFKDAFVLFKPKDIVSGDFYWISDRANKVFYATADCTGHGVPGGFMSMLGTALLNEIIDEKQIEDCGEVLNQMRERIIQSLKQSDGSESKDGMDMTLICIDKNSKIMSYAAANNNFYILRAQELIEMNCDKMPVGVYHGNAKPFNTYTFQLQNDDVIYSYTDGYADQFGGPKGKKYTYKKLKEKLTNPVSDLQNKKLELNNEIEGWKGQLEQIDDICLIGVKL